MDTTFSYQSMLGGSNGSLVGGEPLHQGIVTDQCYVNTPEYIRRKRVNLKDPTLYGAAGEKPVDQSKYRIFEHEICLAFNDNLGHKPMLMNFDTRVGGVSSAFTKRVYESAGLSSTKLSAFPNVFSCLNGVSVSIPTNLDATVFPNEDTYDTFIAYLTTASTKNGGPWATIKDHFPVDYKHFLAHFAFKCIGTAKTNDHAPKRGDIPVNIAGLVHPPATKLINAGDQVEWYLPFPKEISEFPETVKHTGNDHDKILVGLRPHLGCLTSVIETLVDELGLLDLFQIMKLKLTLNAFLTCRYMGKALRTTKPGEPCYLSLAKGPYCL